MSKVSPHKTVKRFIGIVKVFSGSLVFFSYAAFTVATVTTLVDVFLRYVLDKPILGVIELNECMMPILVFMALALTQRERGHIRVEIIVNRLRAEKSKTLGLLVDIVGCAFVALMGLTAWNDAVESFARRESVLVGLDVFPIWWAKFFIPIGLWTFSVQYLADIAQRILFWTGKVKQEQGGLKAKS